ncbi:hypothetical protein L7F22_015988 [Adiantum nelumboides]|nr:hypothetical protein [Adiantum nelumboides]
MVACGGALSHAGVTSSYVRKLAASQDMPINSEAFRVPEGFNAPQQVHITQGDYDGRAVIISWVRPSNQAPHVLSYGLANDTSQFVEVNSNITSYTFANYKSGFIHHCVIKDLMYDTNYTYRIGQGSYFRQFWFITPPKPGPDVAYTFGVIGDLGQTYDSQKTFQHYKMSNGQTVLYLGDLSYADRYPFDNGERWDTWGRFVEPSTAYQPWLWTAGNHEIEFRPEFVCFNLSSLISIVMFQENLKDRTEVHAYVACSLTYPTDDGMTQREDQSAGADTRKRKRYPEKKDARPKLTPQERSRLMREGKCFGCGEPGHISAKCPKKAPKEQKEKDEDRPESSRVAEERGRRGKMKTGLVPDCGEVKPFKPFLHRYATPYIASKSTCPLWYAVRRGSAHLIILSSYSAYGKYTPQWIWLRNEFERVDRKVTPWLIVLMHAPLYNSNTAHYMEGEGMRAEFETWFLNYKVDVVFAGHVHAYERSRRVSNVASSILNGPRIPTHDKSAPVYVTVGDGGNIEGLAGIYREPQPDYSAFREASYGHAMLEIKNKTHARLFWHRNDDGEASIADEFWLQNQIWGQTQTHLLQHVNPRRKLKKSFRQLKSSVHKELSLL